MSDKIFSIQEDLTEYQQNVNKQDVIGYFKNPYIVEPKKNLQPCLHAGQGLQPRP